ncbi:MULTISPECIES: hypothetical protein [Rahnella]|jgi:hypothetical protein|uniref:hypothetical protein n=1 Tax=Rahnella TaxID=34037 RepID=UPI003F6E1B5F
MKRLNERPDEILDAASKIVGQYILMRCTTAEDFNRAILVEELTLLNQDYKVASGETDFAMELAIEILMR